MEAPKEWKYIDSFETENCIGKVYLTPEEGYKAILDHPNPTLSMRLAALMPASMISAKHQNVSLTMQLHASNLYG